mgnify:CR=1 FL=1
MEQKIRVLIADDRPHSRDGLRALVTTWPNVEVAGEAGDGREAVQLVEACHPDVVLMDVRMPGMDGLVATRIISRVIRTFQLELPIKALFDAPTVARMALLIEQNQTKLTSDEEMNRLLNEIEAMTEGEVQRRVDGK